LTDISDIDLMRFEDNWYRYKSAFDALDNFYRQNDVDLEHIIND